MNQVYDLIPTDSRKSFYGKARVEIGDGGDLTLFSYNQPIVRQYVDGTIKRIYPNKLSLTTARHLKSFCGLTSKDFEKLEWDK